MLEIQVIKRTIKASLIWLFRLPLFKGLRRWLAKRYVIILLYHKIDPDLFASHLEYLKRNYNIIALRDLRDAFVSKMGKVLPLRSLVITFDDGWKSNYKLLPVFRKHDRPVTIFLAAGLVNTNRKIWNFAIDRTDRMENDRLKALPNEEKERLLKDKYSHYPEKEYCERSMLNKTEIEEMALHVDFQSHGMFHPVFTMCSEKELAFELSESRKLLSQMTNTEIYAIAYPYNRAWVREREAARAAGYQLGRIGGRRLNRLNGDPMALKAIGIKGDSSMEDLAKSIVWAQIREFLYVVFSQNRAR